MACITLLRLTRAPKATATFTHTRKQKTKKTKNRNEFTTLFCVI